MEKLKGWMAIFLGLSTVAQMLAGCSSQAQPSLHPSYTYMDYSANLPSVAQPGQSITLVWLAYPTGQMSSASAPLVLSILLFRTEEGERGGACLTGHVPLVTIDVIQTDTWSFRSYQRTIMLPTDLTPGQYDLTRKVHTPHAETCTGNVIRVSAPSPVRQPSKVGTGMPEHLSYLGDNKQSEGV